jgi:hypothetical protein
MRDWIDYSPLYDNNMDEHYRTMRRINGLPKHTPQRKQKRSQDEERFTKLVEEIARLRRGRT